MANSNLLYGTWQFNEVLESYPSAVNINFTCLKNGKIEEYKAIGKYPNSDWFCYFHSTNYGEGFLQPYQQDKWVDEEYRTIRISTAENATILKWLQTNAVKLADDLEYDPRTNKEKYNDLMNELSDVINEKAGTTGKKVLSQMVVTAKTIKTGGGMTDTELTTILGSDY